MAPLTAFQLAVNELVVTLVAPTATGAAGAKTGVAVGLGIGLAPNATGATPQMMADRVASLRAKRFRSSRCVFTGANCAQLFAALYIR